MVSIFAKYPSGRSATRRSKHFLEDRVGSKRISPAAALQGDSSFGSFQPIEQPDEPVEHDLPLPSPVPEPSISEDGILWRARVLESLRRRSDILAASKDRDGVMRGGSIPSRRTHDESHSMERFLFEAHSAPEFEVRKLLE